jgi:dipeptidyl aminopeptidase/acylaminoacyl peptidase
MSLRLVVLTILATTAAAAPVPVENFARRPQMHGVSISADGRYVAFLSGVQDDTVLMTFDRVSGGAFKKVTASEPDKFDIGWCRWANDSRLLCGLYGNIRGKKYAEPPFKRLFAVDANGSALKLLEQARNEGNLLVANTDNKGAINNKAVQDGYNMGPFRAERQDNVLDLTPEDRDSVLIQADDDGNSYPSIYRLNIYNGNRVQIISEKQPIQTFISDGHGSPRLGWGISKDLQINYFSNPDGKSDWRPLTAVKSSGDAAQLRPVALAGAENSVYAVGPFEGRDALWSIDVGDQRPPKLLFKHPLVDVGEPILQSDNRLLGVRYDVEKPYVWYANTTFRDVIDKLERHYLHEVHEIVDSSADLKTLVVRQSSDVDDGTYFIYNVDENRLQRLGAAYPDLDRKSLGTMSNILYKATDGTEIPGYLTIPSGAERKNLPLIVMPHDGPVARDSWKFNFLRNFLANRGYAVLQMNYRGSAGFGEAWHIDHQRDWNATIYSDIQDATRWAIAEGIADPARVCILGWGFGGYEALLSAARAGSTYRCAISVAGIADLESQQQQAASLGNTELQRAIGTDREIFRRNSPLAEAAHIRIPVLLVHGTRDWQVQVDQTKAMDGALESAHTTVLIKNAWHDLDRQSDRITLLQSVETFLKKNLGAGAAGS